MHSFKFVAVLVACATALSALVITGAIASQEVLAEAPKSPEWLTQSETYGFGSAPWSFIQTAKWRFVTHVPASREYLMALRAIGKRGFPYVTFYQAHIFGRYQGMNLSEHTDWLAIDEKGRWRRTGFWDSEDAKNMYCTCFNTEGYRKALLAYVRKLMEMGAGGVFIDNVGFPQKCYGEKFGAHKHVYPTEMEAFTALLKETRELIRSYDPDGALFANSASPATLPDEWWRWIDCEMSESYICTWVSTTRWGDWHKDWNGMDKKISKWMKAGKQVCCLSYVGHTTNNVKDDCFFCYASARIMNMIWQGGRQVVYDDPELSVLYHIETGQPVTEEKVTSEGLHYRVFKKGVVAVNPTDKEAAVEIKREWPTSLLRDVYSNTALNIQWLTAKTGVVKLSVPPQSGRVYVFEPSTNPYIRAGLAAQPASAGYTLTIETSPTLAATRFKVDGIPVYTHSGSYTTKYEKGANFGRCSISFEKSGVHTIEVIDLEKKALMVADNYWESYKLDEDAEFEANRAKDGYLPRLGKLMDPADPVKFMEGGGYAFEGWDGAGTGKEKTVTVRVDGPTRLVAKYRKLE
ncbi:MAG: hypothetical protein HYX78_07365 [Armatimonadetes bacterium]|nr:hypothetical protein [Armatimonadota bacterium]